MGSDNFGNLGEARDMFGVIIQGPIINYRPNSPKCPCCGFSVKEQEVRNYNANTQRGDVYCTHCGAKVRSYDGG
jgi:hypothetical protein